jgi:hypothetical protein
MRHLFLFASFGLITFSIKAQTAVSLINELNAINKGIANKPCSTGKGMVITNRAMNVFLADKTGYLSEQGDLSLYTNYVTLNTSTGTLAINHNFQKAKGTDEPIKSFFNLGIEANFADGFNTTFLDKKFKNELGLNLKQIWLGKVKTHFIACKQDQTDENLRDLQVNQKHSMDALRAGILHSLEMEINKKEADFKMALNAIDSANDVPGQNPSIARALALQNFYIDLKEEYEEKFAKLQAETLTKTKDFKFITTHWTSFVVYIPLFFPTYNVAGSFTFPFQEKHPYPFELTISHTWLREDSKLGRLFITISGKILGNNSIRSFELDKTSFTQYKNLGGTDTLHLASLKNDEIYIGRYGTFLTSVLRGRIVYFPPDSHIGMSFLLEQNFGRYNLLNGRLGLPIVLINSKKLPSINFEFDVAFFDMTHKIKADKKFENKTSIGLGIGIPLSRLMY